MKERIDNLDLIIAARDLLKEKLGSSIHVYDAVYPNKGLPGEFVLVRALKQSDDGNVDIDGTVEVCIYVKNLQENGDGSRPDLSRIRGLTKEIYAILFDAEKNGVFFNRIDLNLVKDADTGYFYNSLIIETKSINLKYYKDSKI
jgi:hypothetical protein